MRILLLLFPIALTALEIKPWLPAPGDCELRSAYTYRYYPSVNGGFNPDQYSSHDQYIDLGLRAPFLPCWEAQAEVIFSDTRRVDWGTQSAAVGMRYQFLDDISKNVVSLTGGVSIRWVTARNLRDVSCPYHARWDFEFSGALGKEWTDSGLWVLRTFGYLTAGFGSKGSPWVRALVSVAQNFSDRWRYEFFGEGYFGFGDRNQVNIDHFNGYGPIHHQSVDVGLKGAYQFPVWGALSFTYAYRPYAHAFPQHTSTFTLAYTLPFSVL